MARIPSPESFQCTPSSMMASTPCLACLSEKEMLAVIVAILAIAAGKTIPEVVSDSACFTCLSDKQLLQSIITYLGNDLLGETVSAQDVVDQMHCLVCAPQKQLLAALVKLLCDNFTITLIQD